MANLSWTDRKNPRHIHVPGKHTLILTCLEIFEVPRMQRLQKAGIAVLYYFLEGLGGEISGTTNIRVSPAIDNARLSISFRANTLNFL